MSGKSVTLHATCVAVADKGVVITGPSGSGKSALALQLISLGAVLVADDRTVIHRADDHLFAMSPPTIAGMIEARGVGILSVMHVPQSRIALVIDMATLETERMPRRHTSTLLDIELPCLHKVDAHYFPAAIHVYLTGV